MRKAIFKNDPDVGIISVHSIEADCLVEYPDGALNFCKFYDLKFIDSPESEQLAEFAKASMQARLGNEAYLRELNNFCKVYGGDPSQKLMRDAVIDAKTLIAELKKQKP